MVGTSFLEDPTMIAERPNYVAKITLAGPSDVGIGGLGHIIGYAT